MPCSTSCLVDLLGRREHDRSSISILSDAERTTVRRDRARHRVSSILSDDETTASSSINVPDLVFSLFTPTATTALLVSRVRDPRRAARELVNLVFSVVHPRWRRRGDLVSRIRDLRHTADAGGFLSGKSPASVSSSLSDDKSTTVRRMTCSTSCLVDPLGRREHDGRRSRARHLVASILSDDESTTVRRHVLDIVTRRSSRTTRRRSRQLRIHRKRTVCAHWGRPYGVGT